jgi:hypothetical protein
MSKPPQLSNEERRAALLKASAARKLRADFKLDVKKKKVRWFSAFDRTEEAIQKMRIKELLESIPSFGSTRAENILDQIGISHSRRIKGIGVRQKNELLKALERR